MADSNNMKKILLLLLGLSLVEDYTAFAAKPEIYKWTDAAGRVQYGEKPPEENAQKLDIKTGVDSQQRQQTEESLRRMQKENQFYDRGHQEQDATDQKKAEADAKMSKECDRARAQVAKAERGGYVWYTTDADGNRQFKSDKEAETSIEETRGWVEAHCNGL